MKPIFEQLGYTPDSLAATLASIKARHDKSVAQPDYMAVAKEQRRAVNKLEKAAGLLRGALDALPDSVRLHMPETPQGFTNHLARLQDGMAWNFSAGPDNALPTQKTIVNNRFIFFVANEYKKKTGKQVTISVSDKGKGGQFIEFLLAIAAEIGVDTKGMIRRAQELIEKKRL